VVVEDYRDAVVSELEVREHEGGLAALLAVDVDHGAGRARHDHQLARTGGARL